MTATLQPTTLPRSLVLARLALRAQALVQAATPKFGCLMAMLPSLESELPQWAAATIAAEDLHPEGIESETHATALYGFPLDFNVAGLREFLAAWPPLKLKLGELSRFECPEYDVVKFSVESPDLVALHVALVDKFFDGVEPSKWSYKPHVTVAYVNKGAAKGLQAPRFTGRSFTVNQLLYSLPEKQGRAGINLNAQSVQATARPLTATISPEQAKHDAVRDAAAAKVRAAVKKALALAEANALAQSKLKEEEAKKSRREEAVAAILLLLLGASIAAHHEASDSLRVMAAAGLAGSVGIPGATMDEAAAEAFAQNRRTLLEPFAQDAVTEMETEVVAGVQGGETRRQLDRRLQGIAERTEAGRGEVVAQTEAQAVYGDAQRRILQLAGYSTKVWRTQEDERVRETHVDCGEQGEVPMDVAFSNGLQFPGDPSGGPEEVINCRCYLQGGTRREVAHV